MLAGAAGVLLAGYFIQCTLSAYRTSATFDEPVYIAAGDVFLQEGSHRIKRDAPPLISTLAGWAVRVSGGSRGVEAGAESALQQAESNEYTFATAYFRLHKERARQIIRAARFPIACLGLILGFILFLWARELYGPAGGLVAAGLFCVEPNLIAHGAIVSADLGLATFFCAAHYAYWRWVRKRSVGRMFLLAVSVALCVAVKFSGLLIFLSLGILFAWELLRPSPEGAGDGSVDPKAGRKRLLIEGLRALALAAALTWLLIAILYRSPSGLSSYIDGVRTIYGNLNPNYYAYLLGEFKQGTWPHYYLVAVVLKTSPALLLLVALGWLAWGKNRGRRRELATFLLPIALVHFVCAWDRADLGLRRVLLTYPMMILCAARVARWMEFKWPPMKMPRLEASRTLAAVALCAGAALSNLRIQPHPLTYFNFLAGGPDGAHRFLDDSNLDWGQGLPALKACMEANGIPSVRLSYFGTDLPENYGISCQRMTLADFAKPGREVYAVSIHMLIRQRLYERLFHAPEMDWLSRFKPSAILDHNFYIYDFRER